MKPDVLSLGRFPDATMDELSRHFTVHHFFDFTLPPPGLTLEAAQRVRAIATEANRGANRALIEMLPKLELIAGFGVGYDKTDLAAARERRIPVTNTPGVLGDEVADLAIGLMLASARQIIYADRFVREGFWSNGPISLGRSVGGKTLGVIGLGGIGRATADRGAAFKMRVLYHGPRAKPDAPYEYVADAVELARRSDYLIVACKGGPQTHHLVSDAVIDALGPQGMLINVARGTCVDERALVAALREGRLGFATVETRNRIGQLMIDNIRAHFAGKPLLTPVPS